jgi:hypothetical protein
VAALVADHLGQELVELRVVRSAHQSVVPSKGRELVDRTPHHVDRSEVTGRHRAQHRGDDPQPVANAEADPQVAPAIPVSGHRGGAVGQLGLGRHLDAVRAQEVREGLTVPELLVDPTAEERRDLGVDRDTRCEQVAQVDHRVRLDVHHVVEAHDVPCRQRMISDPAPLDPAEIDFLRVAQIAIEIELDPRRIAHVLTPWCSDSVLESATLTGSTAIYDVGGDPVHR